MQKSSLGLPGFSRPSSINLSCEMPSASRMRAQMLLHQFGVETGRGRREPGCE